jgi:DNA topoisomerase IB
MSEKHTSRKPLKAAEPEMRSEYDFTGAVRGKYHKQYLAATNVVVLEPDVAKRFKNAASVNKALRAYLKNSKRGLTTGSTATDRKRSAR